MSADFPTPVPAISALSGYSVPRALAPVDLLLDSNEGRPPTECVSAALRALPAEALSRYRRPAALEAELALRLGLAPQQVLVTCGGDGGIDQLCRTFLGPGRELLVTSPTFEMIPYFATLAGGRVRTLPWEEGPYPLAAVTAALGPQTGVLAVVSPNNPTGLVISPDDLKSLSTAAAHCVILLDAAYGPFADESLTAAALALPNVVLLHTFSKAYGMAGLRVGYLAGPVELMRPLRAAGGPYPVSVLSLVAAETWLREGATEVADYIATVRAERHRLHAILDELGLAPLPSQANFVTARPADPLRVRDGMAGFGVAVRALPRAGGGGWLRISCPGNPQDFARVCHALRTLGEPEALLLDMDGVLADVSESYREAIRLTALSFGVAVDAQELDREKRAPDSNNDWRVTRRILARHGVEATLEEVTARFEALYQGRGEQAGLRETERLIPPREVLEFLAGRLPLAIVTGRPRADARYFLDRMGLAPLVREMVCMGETEHPKPAPDPLRLAMQRLGVTRAWMVGDTPDDVRAARAAGVLPFGVLAPGDDAPAMTGALYAAGAAGVLAGLEQLREWLP